MKNNFFIAILALVVMLNSCAKAELDPLKISDIKAASLIALRGAAVDNINDTDFGGAIDTISKANVSTTKVIEFEADYISADVSGLASVDVFANLDKKTRVKVATIAGTSFAIPSGGKYARGKIAIPFASILTAIATTTANLEVDSYITISSDLTLKDGSKILASQIVNSSLFETAFFYPAHRVLVLVRP